MQYYVDAFKPFDKAGAYAVQEWIGHCKIIRIEGSYTNIMGLPTERLYRALQSWDETV
jgi:septum formation protein